MSHIFSTNATLEKYHSKRISTVIDSRNKLYNFSYQPEPDQDEDPCLDVEYGNDSGNDNDADIRKWFQ